jgi:hypothetical protein
MMHTSLMVSSHRPAADPPSMKPSRCHREAPSEPAPDLIRGAVAISPLHGPADRACFPPEHPAPCSRQGQAWRAAVRGSQ